MDHLLVPKDPVRSQPRIRYYCLEEHDRGDFITYPERQCWTQEELFTRSTWAELDGENGRGVTAAAVFLQQWLFFGLLHMAFGDELAFQDYIDDEGETKYVHTRNLLAHADQLVKKRDSGLILEADMLYWDRSLHTAYLALDFICQIPGNALETYFILSLSLMGRFVLCLRQVLFPDNDLMSSGNRSVWEAPRIRADISWWGNGTPPPKDTINILAYVMFKEEWCPRVINIFQASFWGLEYRYFASLLCNFQKGRFDHKVCTNSQSFASQIQRSSYRTAHTGAGCSCHFHGFDSTAVGNILETGDLPLVTWNRRDKKINLISGNFNSRYIALSHVWSDGLGNTNQNAMPQCQLEAINDLVGNLDPDDSEQIPFWIDTLCCPTGPSEAKRIAIQKMRDVYAGANKVLVLDGTLRSIDTTGRSTAELALYIRSSNWASRLWTFQEGALPERLIFQFSNTTLDSNAIRVAAESFDFNFSNGWGSALDMHGIYVQIRGNKKHFERPDSAAIIDLGFWADSFSSRTTSVQADEALCLASLMDQDPGHLLNGRRQDRMMRFWSQLTHVSEDWMYFEYSRLDCVGFRWAPKTLLGQVNTSSRLDSRASPTSRGLLVSAYSIVLQSLQLPLSHPINSSVWIRGTDGGWKFYLSKDHALRAAQDSRLFSIPDGHFSRIAVLTTQSICDSGFDNSKKFVMAFVTEEHDGVTYARRGDSGRIFKADHPGNRGRNLDNTMNERRKGVLAGKDTRVSREGDNYLMDGEYDAVIGDWTDEKSQWCID